MRDDAAVLEVREVAKAYGLTVALRGISFEVSAGQIVGLLGPNGAGKSTAMKAIAGILRPDRGTIRVLGEELRPGALGLKHRVGYVPESPALYEFLTGAEYLDFIADLYGLPPAQRAARIEPFLSALELKGHENSLIAGYSNGMKQKVALTAALLHRPRLLILDEALNGLDPRAARIVKDLLHRLVREDGVGVLFSTHVLEIAQTVCDRVVILNRGAVVAEGTVGDLVGRVGRPGSGLEEAFLEITGGESLRDVVSALTR
ncbi:MAG: ABC transporter ATP-binding protein [Thermoplasmata archaeon]